MSGSLTLMLPGNRREVVRTNPTMTLGAALAEVCSRAPRPLGDPDNFCLILNKKELDLSTPVRFAGLASGAKLDVVRRQNANKPAAAPGAPASVSARSDGASVPAAAAAAVQPVQPLDAGAVVAETAAPTAPSPLVTSPLVDIAAKLAGRPVAVYSRQALQSATESSGEKLPSGEDMPEEFYEMTPEDIMRLTKRKEEEVLMTRAMREAAVAKRASVRRGDEWAWPH
jgi:tether containing UBX domain for GLUT4